MNPVEAEEVQAQRAEGLRGWLEISIVQPPHDKPFLAVVDGKVRVVQWGKTSHVTMYGYCLADQGVEDCDLCQPTHWRPMPQLPRQFDILERK